MIKTMLKLVANNSPEALKNFSYAVLAHGTVSDVWFEDWSKKSAPEESDTTQGGK